MFFLLTISPYFSFQASVDQKSIEFGEENIVTLNARLHFPRADIAKNFDFYGLRDGTNIVENLYFCKKCLEYVENKVRNGTNPLLRHCNVCVETHIDLSIGKFSEMLANCLNFAGSSSQFVTTKDELQQKISNLDTRITDKNLWVKISLHFTFILYNFYLMLLILSGTKSLRSSKVWLPKIRLLSKERELFCREPKMTQIWWKLWVKFRRNVRRKPQTK